MCIYFKILHLSNGDISWAWWYMPFIPALEAETNGEGTCHWACRPEFNLWVPHGRSRELTLQAVLCSWQRAAYGHIWTYTYRKRGEGGRENGWMDGLMDCGPERRLSSEQLFQGPEFGSQCPHHTTHNYLCNVPMGNSIHRAYIHTDKHT